MIFEQLKYMTIFDTTFRNTPKVCVSLINKEGKKLLLN